jgi:glycosyltransferase involved in cell wall biosynthesis/GR25 family glycosyltransferase involved in LPS biosynthesis
MSHIISNKATKAYIIRLSNNPTSVAYAKATAESCDKVGLEWEYFEGYDHWSVQRLVLESGIKLSSYTFDMSDGAASASFSHFKLWDKIKNEKTPCIVLEHDAIVLHKLDLNIPDNMILNLGYKVSNYKAYDSISAGPSKKIIEIDRQAGAHAYAITPKTAAFLIKELETVGFYYSIDAAYFLPPRSIAVTSIKLGMTDPVCALGWLRESTIDNDTANFNYKMLDSFSTNFRPISLLYKNKPVIAFLDYTDLDYNPDTLKIKGMGGSETALINMAKELSEEFNVFVFNNTSKKGLFDKVQYYNYKDTADIDFQYQSFDILISMRNVLPFVDQNYTMVMWEKYRFNLQHVNSLVNNSKYKILWAHDTITTGEEWLPELFKLDRLHQIIVLSDYQYNLYLNKNEDFPHIIKNKIFRTRNGIEKLNTINFEDKDPDLFIYTSAYVKGMRALLEDLWPQVKKEFPKAKLQIVGGAYRDLADEDYEHSTYWEKEFINARKKYNGILGIEFIGFKNKEELNECYKKASYMLLPSEYPETFGLTVLEAINNNVIIIANAYGALEEICPEGYCGLVYGKYKKEDNQLFIEIIKDIYYNNEKQLKIRSLANEYKSIFLWSNIKNEWIIKINSILNIETDKSFLKSYANYISKILEIHNQRIINRY